MGRRAVAMLAAATAALGACEAGSLVPDAGGGGGTGGTGGTVCLSCPVDGKLSDFEDIAVATIVQAGSPPRNGTWYTYNDGSATCLQAPAPMTGSVPPQPYVPEAPATSAPSGQPSAYALHARWSDCTTWGAGIGADINTPLTPNGAVYTGPKVPYDLTPFTGVTFWAMATPGTDTSLRIKLPMRAETRIEGGGVCVESDSHKCSDDWGEAFTLPSNGNWKQVTVRFVDAAFMQEAWGAVYPWNPTDVTSIQIQSRDQVKTYDFWIDDVYLIR